MNRRRTLLVLAARGQTSWWQSALAAFAVAVWALLGVATYVVYDLRAQADAARSPVAVEGDRSGPASTRWAPTLDRLADDRTFSVIRLEPQGPHAPLPPGLTVRLKPGEVALSPALARDGADQLISRRYGRTVTTIGRAGLAMPSERLAYVRPQPGRMPPNAPVVSSFGAPAVSGWQLSGGSSFGDSLEIRSLQDNLFSQLALVGLPAVAILLAMRRIHARKRDRRNLVMAALGAPPRLRRVASGRAATRGVLVGTGLAWGLLSVLAAGEARIPYAGFIVPRELFLDPRPVLAAIVVALLVVGAFATQPRRRAGSVRVLAAPDSVSSWRMVIGPVTLLVAVNFFQTGLLLWIGSVAALIAMTVSAAAFVGVFGQAIRAWGTRAQAASGLLAGSWLARAGRQSLVVAAGLMLVIGLAFQVMTLGLLVADGDRKGKALAAEVGPSVAVVDGFGSGSVEPFLAALPDSVAAITVWRTGERSAAVRADCPSLRALAVPCSGPANRTLPPRARRILNGMTLANTFTVTTAPATLPSRGQLLLVERTGKALDLPALAILSHRDLPGFAAVEPLSRTGNAGLVFQVRWITLYAIWGLCLTLATVAVGLLVGTQRIARQLAPVLALFGHHRRTWSVVSGAVGLPFLLIGAVSLITGASLAMRVRADMADPTPLDTLALVILGLLLVATALLVALAGRQCMRAAASWRPGAQP